MTTTYYYQGFGKRGAPPECQARPAVMECPCCEGAGEHAFGHGMDQDASTCSTCSGYGHLTVATPKPCNTKDTRDPG